MINGKVSQIKNKNGEVSFPVTTSKAVYMQDGTTTVEKKFEEVNSSLESNTNLINEHIQNHPSGGGGETHTHSNKSVLDAITSAKVSEWNNKSTFDGNYNNLTNKPTSFNPSTHTHNASDVTGIATNSYLNLDDYCTYNNSDDSDNLLKAIEDAKTQNKILYLPKNRTIKITKLIDAKLIDIQFEGIVNGYFATNITTGFVVGDSSYYGRKRNIFINAIKNTNSSNKTTQTLSVKGMMGGFLTINDVDYMELYANGNTVSNSDKNTDVSAIAYNTFNMGHVRNLKIHSNTGTTKLGWVNENLFLGGRYDTITFDGSYAHEQNIFVKPSVESGYIHMKSGNANVFYSTRTEGSTIKFEANTRKNIVYDSFYDGMSIDRQHIVSYDYGNENEVVTTLQTLYTKTPIFDLIPNLTWKALDNSKYVHPETFLTRMVLSEDKKLIKVGNYARIFDQRLDTKVVKRFRTEWTNTNGELTQGGGVMMYIKCYDENGNILEPSSTTNTNTFDCVATGIMYQASNKQYLYESNMGTLDFLISNRTKYVDFKISGGYFGENGQTSDCKRFAFYGISKPFEVNHVELMREKILTTNL